MNKNILNALEGNELVIVIGNDLSVIRLLKSDITKLDDLLSVTESAKEEGDYVKININDYLAFNLSDFYEINPPILPFSLNNVVEFLIAENITTEDDIKAYIIRIVRSLTDEEIVLEPFQKLVKISNIDTILSVNFDNFLERAFEAEGKKVNPSINFSIQNSNNSDENMARDKALPRIFNLMGNILDADFALTEEMQLEYVYNLLIGKDSNTKTLFNAVKNKSILFIGCSFPNWYMRFFIRTISKNRYKTGRSKFVASDRTAQDIDLSSFLKNNKTSVIPIGAKVKAKRNDDATYKNTVEFINELFTKIESSSSIKTDNEPRFKEIIFLSYSWDDKPIMKKIKNEFEKCGVQLFFDDDDLRNGDKFEEVISHYINKCDYILPLISENSISRKESYVYEKEWTQANYVEKFKKSSGFFKEGQDTNIRPYIIDKTAPTDNRIPEEIRKKNISIISSEDDFGSMVRQFIKENNLTEIKK